MPNTPPVIARSFYEAFARRDWQTMASLYADDARFSDPVFPDLSAHEARQMWQMLITRGSDLRVSFIITHESEQRVRVHWRAEYTFSQTGRPVINEIDAEMDVVDGKIRHHTDHFSFWRWSRQALGLPGWLLGWTPFLRDKVRATAAHALASFQARQTAAGNS